MVTDDAKGSREVEGELRRAVLLSARFRTAPVGAVARERVLDQLVERNLAAAGDGGLLEGEVQQLNAAGGQDLLLWPADVSASLKRLVASGRVIARGDGHDAQYCLTQEAKTETEHVIARSEESLNEILAELFGNYGKVGDFRGAFLQVVCGVFGTLGDLYVRGLCQGEAPQLLAGHQVLTDAVGEALLLVHDEQQAGFQYGVQRFFQESSPDFDALKWNLAQNYYILKLLGRDEAAGFLSRDLFKGTSLVLDTNVLVAALSPGNRHHRSLKVLGEAFRSLGVELVVTGPTARELRRLLLGASEELRTTFDRIPTRLLPKVGGFLLDAFLSARTDDPSLELEEFLRRMDAPFLRLESVMDITHVDDCWFEREESSEVTLAIAREIAGASKTFRGRAKKDAAALHDALLVRWLEANEAHSSQRRQLLTLDRSLLNYQRGRTRSKVRVVSLDALLQWTGAVGLGASDGDDLAGLYAQVLAFELFPKARVFSLADFRVFADMEIETAQLPAEDVEACVMELRGLGPSYDPTVPEDREKIQAAVQRYFADPGRKYKEDLQNLGAKLLESESKWKKAQEEAAEGTAKATVAVTEADRWRDQVEREVAARNEAEERVRKLEAQIETERERKENRSATVVTVIRLGLLLILLLIGWGIVLWIALQYGQGPSTYSRLVEATPFFGGVFVVVMLLHRVILGKKGRATVKRWFGGSD